MTRPSHRAVCAGLLAVLALWLLLPGRGELARHAVSDTAFVLAPAWAAWRCWRAGWRLLAWAAAAWALGSVVWGFEQVVLGDVTSFASAADAGYLLFPLLAAGGLLRAAALPVRGLRLALDGVAVAASLLLVAWLGALGNLQRADDAVGQVLALAFAVCDLLAAATVALVLDRLPRHSPLTPAALGVAGVVATDGLYAVLAGRGSYAAGGLLDLAWPAFFLVVASAARSPAEPAVPAAPSEGCRLLPAVPAAVAFLALVASGRLQEGLDVVLTTALVVLVGALAARQTLLAGENARLHRSLRTRLDDAEVLSHRRATVDLLTGLPNREAFTSALEQLVGSLAPGQRLGLVLLDLDGFQQVNDAFGHDIGDALLVAVTGRLQGALRGGELLARLDGDEFAVILPGLRRPVDALSVAGRLTGCLQEPLRSGDLEVVLGASAGTATTTSSETPAAELLRDADTAMYAAKEAGGGQSRMFAPAMHTVVRDRLQLESDLRVALLGEELFLHYQPVVDLAADRVAGLEALCRWEHPSRGSISPVDFIPAAERTGLVVALERRVLELACAQIAVWRRLQPGLTVAVNVSARHLSEPDFLELVLSTLGRHALPPSALVLEVTESLLFDDDDHVRTVLDRLHRVGVGLALDDFGTGYSSLSRLARYPFDTLKIDRAFVMDLEDTSSASPVLTATLAMARGLGMSVVAEGVETPAQLAFLQRHGCDLAQGYLLSRPGPAADVAATLGRGLLPAPA